MNYKILLMLVMILIIIIIIIIFNWKSYMNNNKLLLHFKKTICFGTCPIYDALIFDDGTVIFEGKDYVKYIGTKQLNLSNNELNSIKNKINSINFFDLNSIYDDNITDLPSTYITYFDNNDVKTIKLRANVPKQLNELDNLIHNIITDKL